MILKRLLTFIGLRKLLFKCVITPIIIRSIVRPDEDGIAYLLDLLQEDEKRLYIIDRTCFDRQYNIEVQEQLKKLIKNYGYSY